MHVKPQSETGAQDATQKDTGKQDTGKPSTEPPRAAMARAPHKAEFTWRAHCSWRGGTHCRSSVNGFFGLGKEQERAEGFDLDSDHPALLDATDKGPTPFEILLTALASCLTANVAAVALERDIEITALDVTTEGDVNMQGPLGIDPDIRSGFGAIRITFHIEADAPPREINTIVAQARKRSAIHDIIANPGRISTRIT